MVIPIHDLNPVRRTPWVTYLLIALNIGVFLSTPVAGLSGAESVGVAQVCEQRAFFERYAAIPRELTENDQLPRVATGEVGIGRRGVGCVVGEPTYEKNPFLSVLSAMFLHGGWLHLLGNLLFLWIFGNNVEDLMGRIRFLLFYLICGYVATYGFALSDPSSQAPLVGASGAIAGVLGAYIVFFPQARVTSLVPFLFFIPIRLPAWIVLGLWFGLQWLYSAGYGSGTSGVAYLAHVFGFLTGVLLALPFGAGRRRPPPAAWPPPPAYPPGYPPAH